ncbi:MAB_1171c family putative transporter [Rhodococcoides fascians]|uniref:MAB_1171c family putative transporter n=1 Tax=Rhodococcoides fascians TaxID=1828 RepID=UPI00050BF933|nr:MAB_1171c family putative transporter [Rhodococcus fascians]
MTSPVPAWISWPIIVLMALTLVVRVAWLNSSIIDRLTTRSLVIGWFALVLRENAVQDAIRHLPKSLGDVALFQQLTFCCIVMVVMAIYGMSRLWVGADPSAVWKRQRVYDAIGLALSAVILISGTPSRKAGELVDQYLGWPAVVLWTAFYAPILFVAVAVMRIFVREARHPDTAVREKALYGLAIAIAVGLALVAVSTPILTFQEVLTGSGSADPEMHVKALTFFLAVAGSLIMGAVPVLAVLRAKLGQDRISKNLKEIELLWQDMTDQFPEVRTADSRQSQSDPAMKLHRKIIEIHDAARRLSKWNASTLSTESDALQLNAESIAAELAQAYAAKTAGQMPPERYELLTVLAQRSGAYDLTATSDDLVDVARAWRKLRHQQKVRT